MVACCFFLEDVVSLMNRNWTSFPEGFLEVLSESLAVDVCLECFLSGETSWAASLRFLEVETDLD